MGNNNSIFNEDELENYKKWTYLSGPEILHCFQRFKSLNEKRVEANRKVRLPKEDIIKMPELAVNPLADRIVHVFSNGKDTMDFEDFLNMMSVFSEAAPNSVKCYYAFEIYDFNDTKALEREDIKDLIQRLIGQDRESGTGNNNKLKESDMDLLVNKIFQEADIDENNVISLDEFEHVVAKSPDFASLFCIRL